MTTEKTERMQKEKMEKMEKEKEKMHMEIQLLPTLKHKMPQKNNN